MDPLVRNRDKGTERLYFTRLTCAELGEYGPIIGGVRLCRENLGNRELLIFIYIEGTNLSVG